MAERRILMTQWVGQAWESIHHELQHTIQRSFRKCGITVAIDGSEDDDINIRGLDNYRVDSPVASSTVIDTSDTSESDSDSDQSTTSSRSGIFGAEIMD